MIKGKFPLDYINVSSVEMFPEGWKVNCQYINENGGVIGTFIWTDVNMKVSENTEKLLSELLKSLENDVYENIFSSAPEKEVEEKEEPTFEERIGVRDPRNITLVDDYDIG